MSNPVATPKTKQEVRVRKLLEWLMDHRQEDTRVNVGCKTCKENTNLLASTALTAWLNPFHSGHDVWIRSPFTRKGKYG